MQEDLFEPIDTEESTPGLMISIVRKNVVKMSDYGHALINEDEGIDVMVTASGVYIAGMGKEDTLIRINKKSKTITHQAFYNILTDNEYKKKAEWVFESSDHVFDNVSWIKIKLNNISQ